jgi:capsular polysaccharide biosynthesis protein
MYFNSLFRLYYDVAKTANVAIRFFRHTEIVAAANGIGLSNTVI